MNLKNTLSFIIGFLLIVVVIPSHGQAIDGFEPSDYESCVSRCSMIPSTRSIPFIPSAVHVQQLPVPSLRFMQPLPLLQSLHPLHPLSVLHPLHNPIDVRTLTFPQVLHPLPPSHHIYHYQRVRVNNPENNDGLPEVLQSTTTHQIYHFPSVPANNPENNDGNVHACIVSHGALPFGNGLNVGYGQSSTPQYDESSGMLSTSHADIFGNDGLLPEADYPSSIPLAPEFSHPLHNNNLGLPHGYESTNVPYKSGGGDFTYDINPLEDLNSENQLAVGSVRGFGYGPIGRNLLRGGIYPSNRLFRGDGIGGFNKGPQYPNNIILPYSPNDGGHLSHYHFPGNPHADSLSLGGGGSIGGFDGVSNIFDNLPVPYRSNDDDHLSHYFGNSDGNSYNANMMRGGGSGGNVLPGSGLYADGSVNNVNGLHRPWRNYGYGGSNLMDSSLNGVLPDGSFSQQFTADNSPEHLVDDGSTLLDHILSAGSFTHQFIGGNGLGYGHLDGETGRTRNIGLRQIEYPSDENNAGSNKYSSVLEHFLQTGGLHSNVGGLRNQKHTSKYLTKFQRFVLKDQQV